MHFTNRTACGARSVSRPPFFGSPSIDQPGTDCPAGGSWEGWCDCMWKPGSDLNAKCRAKPQGFLTLAPWTDVGAAQRGIPKAGPSIIADTLNLLSASTGNNPVAGQTPKPPAPASSGILGLPTAVAVGGLGVLALGIVAFAARKRRG